MATIMQTYIFPQYKRLVEEPWCMSIYHFLLCNRYSRMLNMQTTFLS